MSRTHKLVLLCAILAIIASAAAITHSFLSKDPTDAGISSEQLAFSVDVDSISIISWQNDKTSTVLRRVQDKWEYAEDSVFPLNTDYPAAMLRAVSLISYSKKITEPELLSEYGLDSPQCVVVLKNGTCEYTLKFGNTTVVDEQQYFSCGDGCVYLVSPDISEKFEVAIQDLLQKEAIPNMSRFVSLRIDTSGSSRVVKYIENSGIAYSDYYTWFLFENEQCSVLDNDLADTFTDNVRYLTWGSCVSYDAEEPELAEFGLTAPKAVISCTYLDSKSVDTGMKASDGTSINSTEYTENTFTIELGNSYSDEAYYARIAGSRMVYLVTDYFAETLLNTSASDLAPDEILKIDWDKVSSADLLLDERKCTFTARAELKGSADEYAIVWYLNGNASSFDSVTALLDKLYFSGYAPAELTPTGERLIGFVFHQQNEQFPTVELTFYSYNTEDCLVTLNGSPTVFVSRKSILSLAAAALDAAK